MMTPKLKLSKSRKSTIVILGILLIVGIPGVFFLKRSVRVFDVYNIEPENEPTAGTEVTLIIQASYGNLVGNPIKTAIYPNRFNQKVHIMVYSIYFTTWEIPTVENTNQTINYTFPTSGTWEIIAGDYSIEIIVS